jgi:hypothetical protein
MVCQEFLVLEEKKEMQVKEDQENQEEKVNLDSKAREVSIRIYFYSVNFY